MKKFILILALFVGLISFTPSAFAETKEQCLQRIGTEYNDCARTNPTDQNHVMSCFAVLQGATTTCNQHLSASYVTCQDDAQDTYIACRAWAGSDSLSVAFCSQQISVAQANCQTQYGSSTTAPSGLPLTVTTPSVTATGASSTGTNTPVTLTNPLGTTDIRLLVARLIKAVLSIIGVIALLMFVYGGVLWMISAGNEGMVKKGKDILLWTTLGIILIVSAYVIVNALFKAAFTGAL